MSSRMNLILIIGATSGIGEAFTRKFHSMGKKVIAAGRRQQRLDALAKELSGIEIRQFDAADIPKLSSQVQTILNDFPNLDTVILNAGIQQCYNLFDPTSISEDAIVNEITINLTSPNILSRLFAPHLLNLASSGTQTTLMITSSTLAYVPLSFYPTYCPTKAGAHALALVLRQQLAFSPSEEGRKNMRIVEIVPPYTDTGLDKNHREATVAMQGGSDKAIAPMPLQEYVDKFFVALEQPGLDGSIKPELGIGFGEQGVDTWRSSFGKMYEYMGIST